MSLWFRRSDGLNSDAMRDIAQDAGVSWSADTILYRGVGIGFADGDAADATAIKESAESVLGYRPAVIDEPTMPELNDQS